MKEKDPVKFLSFLSFLAFSISIQLSLADLVGAQTAKSCDDIRFKAEILESYPDARKACRRVVERDGVDYVGVRAVVERATTLQSETPLRVRVEGLDRTIEARAPADLRDSKVTVEPRGKGARTTRSQLKVGDRLNLLIPLSEFEAQAIDHVAFRGADDDLVVVEAAAVALPDVAARGMLPKTASSWPAIGLVGMLCLAAAGGLRRLRRIR
jgi:hypothetical protein